MKTVAVQLNKISKKYDLHTLAVDNVTLKIFKGQWTAIMGPSGSGKTTLLNMISCLDRQTSGVIKVRNSNLKEMNNSALTKFRRENLGVIFQEYYLIPYHNALENCNQIFGDVIGKNINQQTAPCKRAEEYRSQDYSEWIVAYQQCDSNSGESIARRKVGEKLITEPEDFVKRYQSGDSSC